VGNMEPHGLSHGFAPGGKRSEFKRKLADAQPTFFDGPAADRQGVGPGRFGSLGNIRLVDALARANRLKLIRLHDVAPSCARR